MTESYHMSKKKSMILSLMPGEVLFRKGVAAEAFYLVISGKLIIVEPFTATIKREYEKDELLGIPEVLLGENWTYMAEAKTFTSIKIFSKSILFDRIEKLPTKPKELMKYILNAA